MKKQNFSGFVSASELGEFIFCSRAWRLRRDGYEAEELRPAQEAGIRFHRSHGRAVAAAGSLQSFSRWAGAAAALLFLLALLLFWWVR